MLVDAHTHIQFYKENVEKALEDIIQNQIMVCSQSVDIDSWAITKNFALQSDFIIPAFGIHPNRAHLHIDRIDEAMKLMKKAPVLGEIGLDYFFVRDESTYPHQRTILKLFLEEAGKSDKIVNLHIRHAEEDTISLLDQYNVKKAIFHNFDGSLDILNEIVKRRFYITVGTPILKINRDRIPIWNQFRDIASEVPSELFLIETDATDDIEKMPSITLMEVIDELAAVRGKTPNEVIEIVKQNFSALIENDPRLDKYYKILTDKKID